MWNKDRSQILQVINRIDNAEDEATAISSFMGFAKQFGFERYFIAQLVSPSSAAPRQSIFHSNYPTELKEDREGTLDMLRDPVVQYGLRTKFPFNWRDAYAHTDRYGLKMAEKVWEHGIREGYMFPLVRPGVPFAAMTLGSDRVEVLPDELAEIELGVLHLYAKLEKLVDVDVKRDPVKLSPHERDVLQFLAAGKTNWEIGMILGVKETSIKSASLRARRKLDAVNTPQTISTAIARGYILP